MDLDDAVLNAGKLYRKYQHDLRAGKKTEELYTVKEDISKLQEELAGQKIQPKKALKKIEDLKTKANDIRSVARDSGDPEIDADNNIYKPIGDNADEILKGLTAHEEDVKKILNPSDHSKTLANRAKATSSEFQKQPNAATAGEPQFAQAA